MRKVIDIMAKYMQDLVKDILNQPDIDSLNHEEYDKFENKMDSTSKTIERFLKNIYSALGIELAKYTDGKKYKFDKWLCDYLTTKIQTYSLPVGKEIRTSFEYASPLSNECLDVVHHFNMMNFKGEMHEKITKEIEKEKSNIYNKFSTSIGIQQTSMEIFKNYKLALIGRSISIDEIDIFISEVDRCCEEYSWDENEFFTEHDITLINFMKLPNVLKSVRKRITDDLIANYIYDFVK